MVGSTACTFALVALGRFTAGITLVSDAELSDDGTKVHLTTAALADRSPSDGWHPAIILVERHMGDGPSNRRQDHHGRSKNSADGFMKPQGRLRTDANRDAGLAHGA